MVIWIPTIAPLVVFAVHESYIYFRYGRPVAYKDMFPQDR